ncbi:MAG: hypothetical protein LC797_03525 [Chloroflexi bacterium]|nr:hypothetical protein [Chloroflexota bacterium]
MPERSGPKSTRTRRSVPRRLIKSNPGVPPGNSGGGLRDRLRRDPFLFLLCLGALAFVTWAFALTWWVTGSAVPMALALASIAPAFFLFYLRDA